MAGRWIKLYEKIAGWEWYREGNTARVFFHLLITANYKDVAWRGLTIKRGQMVATLPAIADALDLTVKQVRTALANLRATGEITETCTNRYRLVTVNNYDIYQGGCDENEEPRADRGQAKGQTEGRQKGRQEDQLIGVNDENEGRQENENRAAKRAAIIEDIESRYIYIPPIIPPQEPKKPDPIHEEIFDWLGAIPPLAVDDITDFRASPGIDDELIREAIKSTKARGIRQWSYAASILRDAIARGILTGQAFRAAKEVKTNGRRYEADEIHTRSPGRKQRSGAFIEKPGVDWDAIMPEA